MKIQANKTHLLSTSKGRKQYLNSLLDFQRELVESYKQVQFKIEGKEYTYIQVSNRVWKKVKKQKTLVL